MDEAKIEIVERLLAHVDACDKTGNGNSESRNRCHDAALTIQSLVKALEKIRDYPEKGKRRRTSDGYPAEVIYDEFAYKRIVDSYRECARSVLSKLRGSS